MEGLQTQEVVSHSCCLWGALPLMPVLSCSQTAALTVISPHRQPECLAVAVTPHFILK